MINISLYDVKSMFSLVDTFLFSFLFTASWQARLGFGWLANTGQDSSVLVAGADEAQEVLSEGNKVK